MLFNRDTELHEILSRCPCYTGKEVIFHIDTDPAKDEGNSFEQFMSQLAHFLRKSNDDIYVSIQTNSIGIENIAFSFSDVGG